MNVDSVRCYCLSFPLAKESLQWGETLCFKAAKKIFVTLSLNSVPQGLCFKCTPEKFRELCEQEGVGPAPYVGRYNWVLLERFDVLGDDELEDLIHQSYEMVVAKSTGHAKTRARKSPSRKPGRAVRSGKRRAPDTKGHKEKRRAIGRCESSLPAEG